MGEISPPRLDVTPPKNFFAPPSNPFKRRRSLLVSSPKPSPEHQEADLQIPGDISHIPIMREVRVITPMGKNKDTEEDIIVLDDEESSPTKKSKKVDFALKSPKELCTYHTQPVTEHDYKTLAEDEFLNDNIINFYLTWLYENLNSKHKEIIHIYSSHFYTRLKSKPDKKDKSSKTRAEKSYERVKGWTKKINIFDKRMLIFPICEESHWYLVIVCNPGHVLSATRDKDFEAKRSYQQKYGETKGHNPFLMVLDSLGGSHSTALSKIRSYLTFEHLEKKKMPRNFGKEKMAEKHPPIPLQPNSCDCGLFLLHYVELIFKDPEVFLGAMLPDLSKWFNTTDIDYKREDIALLIQKISNQSGERSLRFPKIQFPATRNGKAKSDIIDVDDEDTPLAQRRPDPRLRKIKGGTLGELLASKRPSRSTKYTGNFQERRSPSPESKRSHRSTKFTGNFQERKSPSPPRIFDSPKPHRISFQINKRKHGPSTPDSNDFKNNGSSWENVPSSSVSNAKRFTLKRNNEDTNPDQIRKRKERDEKPAGSSKEMFNLLMGSSAKKSKLY